MDLEKELTDFYKTLGNSTDVQYAIYTEEDGSFSTENENAKLKVIIQSISSENFSKDSPMSIWADMYILVTIK
jgi:hypothetical protein